MQPSEFWVMDDDDEKLVADLELGLGRSPLGSLAYLVRRVEDDRIEEPRARQLEIRLGTGLGKRAVGVALSTLSDRGLVTESTLESEQGPPKAWSTEHTVETAMYDAYATRAAELTDAVRAALPDPETAERGPLRLGLNWQPNGLQVPFYAAQIEEKYDLADVEVEFVHYSGSERALQAVASGEIDVGIVGAAVLTDARQQRRVSRPARRPLSAGHDRVVHDAIVVRRATDRERPAPRSLHRPVAEYGNATAGRTVPPQAGVADDVEILETTGEESTAPVPATPTSSPDRSRIRGRTPTTRRSTS